jgi:hypothetical protein
MSRRIPNILFDSGKERDAVYARASASGAVQHRIGWIEKKAPDCVLFETNPNGMLSFLGPRISVDRLKRLTDFLDQAVELSWHRVAEPKPTLDIHADVVHPDRWLSLLINKQSSGHAGKAEVVAYLEEENLWCIHAEGAKFPWRPPVVLHGSEEDAKRLLGPICAAINARQHEEATTLLFDLDAAYPDLDHSPVVDMADGPSFKR